MAATRSRPRNLARLSNGNGGHPVRRSVRAAPLHLGLAVIVTSVLFGVIHLYQGAVGVLE
jgi:hypothetical protein